MIDIIQRAFATPQIEQILNRGDKIFVGQDALGSLDVNPELLIDFVTADPSKIILLGIEKESLEQSAGVRHGWRIAGAKAAVNILEGFFLIMRGIFSKRFYDRIVVRDIDDFHLVNIERHDLTDRGKSQRLKRARHGHLTIANLC